MKREFILGVFIILLTSFISAEIIINQQPKEVYNLGDTISIPVTIKAQSDISGSFQMNLLCNGRDINFYKNGIKLEERVSGSSVGKIASLPFEVMLGVYDGIKKRDE